MANFCFGLASQCYKCKKPQGSNYQRDEDSGFLCRELQDPRGKINIEYLASLFSTQEAGLFPAALQGPRIPQRYMNNTNACTYIFVHMCCHCYPDDDDEEEDEDHGGDRDDGDKHSRLQNASVRPELCGDGSTPKTQVGGTLSKVPSSSMVYVWAFLTGHHINDSAYYFWTIMILGAFGFNLQEAPKHLEWPLEPGRDVGEASWW